MKNTLMIGTTRGSLEPFNGASHRRRSRTRARSHLQVLAVAAPQHEPELRNYIGDRRESMVVESCGEARHMLQKQPDVLIVDGRIAFERLFSICEFARSQCRGRLSILLLLDPKVHIGKLDLLDVDMVLPLSHDRAELHWWVETLMYTQTFRSLTTQEAVKQLLHATEAKDTLGDGHLQRIEKYALAVGRSLELSPPAMRALRYGALLHDIGKVGTAADILGKPAKLTPEEYQHVQLHPVIGEKIVRPLQLDELVGKIIRHHHERWDGTGYPDRLQGTAIPLCARIVSVVDAYDAMTSQRPYNTPYSPEIAIQTLWDGANSAWDASIVARFTHWLETKEYPRQRYATALAGQPAYV